MPYKFLRKYGEAGTIDFPLWAPDGIDFYSAGGFASGDLKVMKDEGAEGNTANLPTDEGKGYSLVLTSTELAAKRIVIYIVDQPNGSKLWLDDYIIIETYGHANAMHAFNLDADLSGNNENWKFNSIEIDSSAGVPLSIISSSINQPAVSILGNGTAPGMKVVGGATGNGIEAEGGSTSGNGVEIFATDGHGIHTMGGTTGGNGLKIESRSDAMGSANGLDIRGYGIGYGIYVRGGDTASGIRIQGGGTSGDGINVTVTNGEGISVAGGGAFAGIKIVGGATGHGIEVASASGNGIDVSTATGTGINVAAPGGPGIYIDAHLHAFHARGGIGHGIYGEGLSSGGVGIFGQSTSGVGIKAFGTTAFQVSGGVTGLEITGGTRGALIKGGGTGIGMKIEGGSVSGDALSLSATSGHALDATGGGSGHAFNLHPGATGNGINIDATGGTPGGAGGNGIFCDARQYGIRTEGVLDGIYAEGGMNGINAIGNSTAGIHCYSPLGSGIWSEGNLAGVVFSSSAIGMHIWGGAEGVKIQSMGTSSGIKIMGGGVSGNGIDISTTDGHGISISASGANKDGIVTTGIRYGLSCVGGIKDIDADELDTLLTGQANIESKVDSTLALVTIIDGKIDITNVGIASIVAKLPAGTISDFALTDTIDGVAVSLILEYMMAMFNGKFEENQPAVGQKTFLKRNNVTVLSVVSVDVSGRQRIS